MTDLFLQHRHSHQIPSSSYPAVLPGAPRPQICGITVQAVHVAWYGHLSSCQLPSCSKRHGIVPKHGIQVPSFALESSIASEGPQFISWEGVHHVGVLGGFSSAHGWLCSAKMAVNSSENHENQIKSNKQILPT